MVSLYAAAFPLTLTLQEAFSNQVANYTHCI